MNPDHRDRHLAPDTVATADIEDALSAALAAAVVAMAPATSTAPLFELLENARTTLDATARSTPRDRHAAQHVRRLIVTIADLATPRDRIRRYALYATRAVESCRPATVKAAP